MFFFSWCAGDFKQNKVEWLNSRGTRFHCVMFQVSQLNNSGICIIDDFLSKRQGGLDLGCCFCVL